MPNENYDNSTVYTQFENASLTDCGCAVPGLVTVRNCDGEVVGLLTPNDAETYKNGIVEVPSGYVKVFNPISGVYLGYMLPADAMVYITYLIDNNIS
ncbi:MAG: hypothetical protein ACK5B9_04425 [Flavobacteriia bacterium]|jgi:hypothetical protein